MSFQQDTRDDLSRLPKSIAQTVVCDKCANEVASGQAGETSLAEYARIEVGFTPFGLQVWCHRHNGNVVHVDFEGRRLPADFRNLEPKR